jgi:hypothetical protein
LRSSSKRLHSGVRQRLARAASLDREECARLLRHQFAGPKNTGLPLSGSPSTRGIPWLGWRERLSRGRRPPNSWLFEVGVDLIQYQGHCERVPLACPLTDNAQGSQARLGPRLMPPQSQLLAYGPASPVNRSVELVLRSRTSPTRRPVMRSAPEPATRFDGMPSDARLR